MRADLAEELPEDGTLVKTACGGRISYVAGVPWAKFRGERVFFCLPACKEDFEQNAPTSCIVSRLFSQDTT